MAEKLLEENGHVSKDKEDAKKEDGDGEMQAEEIVDRNLMCGWGRWRPDCLQRFSTPKGFIIVLAMFAFSQALLVMGLTNVTIPAMEKEFGLSSKQSAVILLSNDIGGILLLPIVSFYGAHSKKPKWIGIGAIITGIGALLYALPKFMIGKYDIPGVGATGSASSNLCLMGLNQTQATFAKCSGHQGYSSSQKYLAILAMGQFLMGMGTTPLYPLAPAYLDENVDPKMSPLYIGFWFITTFIGPGLGYIVGGVFLKIFTDLSLPEGLSLSQRDPRWIGAWWLGFVSFSAILFLSGAILICFPREMPKYRKKRLQAMKDGQLPTTNEEIGKGLKDLLKALLDLLKNKTYIFLSLALTIKITFAVALAGFFTKIVMLKFGGTLSNIALFSAAVYIPGNVLGIGFGSLLIKKISVKNSAKKAALYLTLTGIFLTGFSAIWLIHGCTSTNIAGARVPYSESKRADSLTSKCNANCGCSRRAYEPVCGKDGITYFSPCFAGCQFKGKGFSGNCTCVQTSGSTISFSNGISNGNHSPSNSSKPEKGSVKDGSSFAITMKGRCDRGCKNIYLFLGLSSIVMATSFSGAIPQKMMTMRCVADNQRAFALGMQLTMMRLLSFIPGPLILGSIIDANCIVWGYDKCGNRGNCLEYRVAELSMSFFIFAIIVAVLATFFYFLSWYTYVAPPTETAKQEINDNAILLSDAEQEKGNGVA